MKREATGADTKLCETSAKKMAKNNPSYELLET